VPEGQDRLRIWAHGSHPAAAVIADRLGLRAARQLLRLGRDLTPADDTEIALPDGVRLRTFRPGLDEAEVVAVNNRAFAWHPEQGTWTEDDIRLREHQDWFDPAGFLIAVDGRDRVLGFHWTKTHPNDEAGPTGEVYVVGVDPSAQGSGLGRALTTAGLAHLARRGLDRVILYVEGDNAPALRIYRSIGFVQMAADIQFSW
jgi:mycothiol synthase